MHILLCVANPEGQEKKQGTGEGYAVFRCDGIVPDQDVVGSGEWGGGEGAEKCSTSGCGARIAEGLAMKN